MAGEAQNIILGYLVDQFKRAATVLHYGYEDEDEAMQLVGIDAIHRAVAGFDAFGPNARLALGCLLDHSDHVVRAVAGPATFSNSARSARSRSSMTSRRTARFWRVPLHPPRSGITNAAKRKDDSKSRLKREGRNFSGQKPNPAIQFAIYAIEQTRDSGPFDTRNLPA